MKHLLIYCRAILYIKGNRWVFYKQLNWAHKVANVTLAWLVSYSHSVSKALSTHWGLLLGKPAWFLHCTSLPGQPALQLSSVLRYWWHFAEVALQVTFQLLRVGSSATHNSQHRQELIFRASCGPFVITDLCFSREDFSETLTVWFLFLLLFLFLSSFCLFLQLAAPLPHQHC